MAGLNAERLAAHRRDQAVVGWPLLAGCPSTAALGAMAYLERLGEDDRLRLVDELNAVENDGGRSLLSDHRAAPRASSLDAYLSAVGQRGPSGLSRVPVKVLAGVRNDDAVGGLDGWIRQVGLEGAAALPPRSFARGLDELVPVSPRRLRRLVTAMMGDRCEAVPDRVSREVDRFVVELADGSMEVMIAYAPSGGRSSHQLDYHVRSRAGGALTSYEQLWRVPSRWDYLTETTVERCVDHRGLLLSTTAGLT